MILGSLTAIAMLGAAAWIAWLLREDELAPSLPPDSLLYRPRFKTWS